MKPILFNGDMVKAIWDNRKSVTRRVIKPQPTNPRRNCIGWDDGHGYKIRQPYQVGDILCVCEPWAKISDWVDVDPSVGISDGFIYQADWEDKEEHPIWRPSIHMPKEAARIFLRVTSISIQKLGEITEEQARNEGFNSRREFIDTFLKLCPECSEESWVLVIEFERISKEEAHNDKNSSI